jgi:hypothetical protein
VAILSRDASADDHIVALAGGFFHVVAGLVWKKMYGAGMGRLSADANQLNF